MAAPKRDLKPAAQGDALDRRDPGFRDRIKHPNDAWQVRVLHRLTKLANIRTRDEAAARADQNAGADLWIGLCRTNGIGQPLADRMAQRVDRRVRQGDCRDPAVNFNCDAH